MTIRCASCGYANRTEHEICRACGHILADPNPKPGVSRQPELEESPALERGVPVEVPFEPPEAPPRAPPPPRVVIRKTRTDRPRVRVPAAPPPPPPRPPPPRPAPLPKLPEPGAWDPADMDSRPLPLPDLLDGTRGGDAPSTQRLARRSSRHADAINSAEAGKRIAWLVFLAIFVAMASRCGR